MRTMIILTALLASLNAPAQLWCPQGAVWKYNIITSFSTGCGAMIYVGDTILAGRNAQHIMGEQVVLEHLSNTLNIYDRSMYTSVSDDIVYQWTPENEWDTLYWFGAVPGDRWYPPGSSDECAEPWGQVEVVDTGHVMINGMALRYLDIGYLGQFGEITADQYRILELIGAPRLGLLPGGCSIIEDGSRLRTYVDDAFPLYDTGIESTCNDITSIAEGWALGDRGRLRLWPNPGNDRVWFAGVDNAIGVSIFDFRGALVLDEGIMLPQNGIDVSNIQAGVYTLVLRSIDGTVVYGKWVKE